MNANEVISSSDAKVAVGIIHAVSESIREAKQIKSGTLYAMLCGKLSLGQYQSMIQCLCNAGLVEDKAHMLRWIGPEIGGRA